MPDLTDLSLSFEPVPETENNEWSICTNDTLIMKNGQMAYFLSVILPSPVHDSAIWEMVKSWSILSEPLLSQWSKMGKDGILVDLRCSSASNTLAHRADYLLEKSSSSSLPIPIVLLWDDGSRNRVTYFTEALHGLPEFGIRLTGTSETAGQVYRQDCFQKGPFSLDNP